MQWNRRGWGKNGRSLPRLLRFRRAYKGALVVTMHDVFDRGGLRQRHLQPDVWSLRWLGRTAERIVVHSQIEVERLRGIIPVEKIRVIPKDYQLDPVRDFPIHVDFLRVAKGAKLTLEIPMQFINEEESPGLARGGVLNVVRYTVEMEVLADAIPDTLIADLTGLDIGDGVHISDVDLPEGATPTISDRDFTIATIAAPAVLTEAEDTGEVEEAEEPELIGEEGEEGEEGEGGEEGEDKSGEASED